MLNIVSSRSFSLHPLSSFVTVFVRHCLQSDLIVTSQLPLTYFYPILDRQNVDFITSPPPQPVKVKTKVTPVKHTGETIVSSTMTMAAFTPLNDATPAGDGKIPVSKCLFHFYHTVVVFEYLFIDVFLAQVYVGYATSLLCYLLHLLFRFQHL